VSLLTCGDIALPLSCQEIKHPRLCRCKVSRQSDLTSRCFTDDSKPILTVVQPDCALQGFNSAVAATA